MGNHFRSWDRTLEFWVCSLYSLYNPLITELHPQVPRLIHFPPWLQRCKGWYGTVNFPAGNDEHDADDDGQPGHKVDEFRVDSLEYIDH